MDSLNLEIPKIEIRLQFPKTQLCSISHRKDSNSEIATSTLRKKPSIFHKKYKNGDYEKCDILDTKEQETAPEPKSKLYKLISDFYNVKKFIQNLRNSTIYRKPKWLKDIHFRIINDWSFFHDGVGISQSANTKNAIFFEWLRMFFYKGMMTLKEKVPVFHPTQALHVIFDCVMLFLTFLYMIIIPINLGFDIDFLENVFPAQTDFIKKLTLFLFFLDIVMTFNTAYFNKGQVITNRKKIVLHYLKRDFPMDLLSLLYLLIFFSYDIFQDYHFNLVKKVLGLFYLIRITNLYKILNRIEEFLFLDEKRYNILAFIKLLFSVLLFSHHCACLWHYIGFFYQDEEITWIHVLNIYNESWMIRYLNSIYFIAVVMNTLGFGDITPTNNGEKGFCIFLIYITCTMFAYIINSIGVILQNLNKDSREFKRYMNVINGYLRQNNINFDLRIKIRNYLEYIWQEEKISNVEEAREIINKRLSKSLKNELILHSNGVFLKNIPTLTENFSEETINKLSYEMKECNMTPGDVIFNRNDLDDCLYIIRKGKVELFLETQKKNDNITILKTLKKGDLIGEVGFFGGTVKQTSARSVTFTSLYSIKRENFINVLKKNNKDFEKFCQMRDQMNLYKNFEGLFLICVSCKGENHSFWDCPLLHLNFSKQRVLSRFNFNKDQERAPFKRLRNHKLNARAKLKLHEYNAKEFNSMVSSEFLSGLENNIFKDASNDQYDTSIKDFEETKSSNDPVIEPQSHIVNIFLKAEESLPQIKEENIEEQSINTNNTNSFTLRHHEKKLTLKQNSESESHLLKMRSEPEKFFEYGKEYDYYFPKNNFSEVLEFCNRKIYENIKKKNLLKKHHLSLWMSKQNSQKDCMGSAKMRSSKVVEVKNFEIKRKNKKTSWLLRQRKKLRELSPTSNQKRKK